MARICAALSCEQLSCVSLDEEANEPGDERSVFDDGRLFLQPLKYALVATVSKDK